MKLNIILITIDSLRADFAKCYIEEGKDNNFMPNLCNFAQHGIIFKNAFANAPYTSASFASLFTSKYPGMVITPHNTILKNCVTMADILKAYGHCTIGIHSNPFLSVDFGFDKGFRYFEDNLLPWNKDAIPKKYHILLNKMSRILRKQPYLNAEVINRKAVNYLEKVDSPFFLWIHYMDTHGPYQSKIGHSYLNKFKAELLWRKAIKRPHKITERELKSLISAYEEEIAYVDGCLGEFLAYIYKMNLLKNTLIIICSDHGDAFYEHGTYSHPRQLYEELIKVLLIIKFPDLDKRKVISRSVSLIDVAPTILDSLGLTLEHYFLAGKSLLPLIKNEDDNKYPHWIICDATPDKDYAHICIRTNEWKFILDEAFNRRELYNLINDPKEKINLINSKPDVAKELEKKLLLHKLKERTKIGDNNDNEKSILDSETKKRLKSLGYL